MSRLTLLLTVLLAGTAVAEVERHQLDEAELASLYSTANARLETSSKIHRTRTQIDGPAISARVDYQPHVQGENVFGYYSVVCEKRGYGGEWACGDARLRHEITVDGDVVRLSADIEVAVGFEVARIVHLLHLTDPAVIHNENARNGVIGKDELQDIVTIEGGGDRYVVSLVGQPLQHNVLTIERIRCGGFSTCGVEVTEVSQSRHLELPKAFQSRRPQIPDLTVPDS